MSEKISQDQTQSEKLNDPTVSAVPAPGLQNSITPANNRKALKETPTTNATSITKKPQDTPAGEKTWGGLILKIIIVIVLAFCGLLWDLYDSLSESKEKIDEYTTAASVYSPAKEETTPNSSDVLNLHVKYNEPLYSTCTLKLINKSNEEITCKLLYVKNSQRYTDVVTIPALGNKEIKYINHVLHRGYKQKVPIHAVAVLKVEVDGLNEEHVYKLVHVSQVTKP